MTDFVVARYDSNCNGEEWTRLPILRDVYDVLIRGGEFAIMSFIEGNLKGVKSYNGERVISASIEIDE